MREFVEKAFRHVGIEVDWQGERGSVDEVREGRQGALFKEKTHPAHAPSMPG